MLFKEKLGALLTNIGSKMALSNLIKVSRPTLDRYLDGEEPVKHEIKIRIDFLYFKHCALKNPSDEEISTWEGELLENQYLIDPREEFVFKDYVKKIAFGSYELESTIEVDEAKFRQIADGGEIEKDISRKNFLEMNNLYALSYKVLSDVAIGKKIEITQDQIKQWHYALMQGVRTDAGEYSSKVRIIANSEVETTPPNSISSAMERWTSRNEDIKSLQDIALSHVEFEKIHPFGDGNGRIGRLIMAVQCINSGYVPPLINKENSAAYYASLEATQLGKKNNALTYFLIEAIKVTTSTLHLLPSGITEAQKLTSGKFLKYGYNKKFMEMAICRNPNILEAFTDASNRLALETVLRDPLAINELVLEFAYGSSKIEGSTFSKLDTKRFLEHGYFPDYKYDDEDPGQKEVDKKMAINNKKTFEYLLSEKKELSVTEIIKIHDMIIDGIGRHGNSGITNDSRMVLTNEGQYLPPVGKAKLELLLNEMLNMYNTIENPFVRALFLQMNIAHIQPFDDGNKRTARAVGNIPLLEAGLIPFSYDMINKDRYVDNICRFYEYGDSVEKFGGVILTSYEKEVETLENIINAPKTLKEAVEKVQSLNQKNDLGMTP